MRAGLLRFPITILQRAETKDDFGAVVITWTEFARTKCNKSYRTGNKQEKDDQITNTQTLDFTIRHNIKVDEQMRLQYDGKLYKIGFINKNILSNSQIITAEYIEKI